MDCLNLDSLKFVNWNNYLVSDIGDAVTGSLRKLRLLNVFMFVLSVAEDFFPIFKYALHFVIPEILDESFAWHLACSSFLFVGLKHAPVLKRCVDFRASRLFLTNRALLCLSECLYQIISLETVSAQQLCWLVNNFMCYRTDKSLRLLILVFVEILLIELIIALRFAPSFSLC